MKQKDISKLIREINELSHKGYFHILDKRMKLLTKNSSIHEYLTYLRFTYSYRFKFNEWMPLLKNAIKWTILDIFGRIIAKIEHLKS